MSDRWYLIFPLAAAVLYSFGAYALKGAQRRGVTSAQAAFWTNIATAVGFMVIFYPWSDPRLGAIPWGNVVAVGLAFYLGQITTILSFEKGGVSIATPMLGSKVLMVALLVVVFLDEPLGWPTWVAAALTTLGVVLLARSGGEQRAGEHMGWGLVLATCAAFCFAVFDVMVQAWSPGYGFGYLLPPAMVLAALMSFSLPVISQGPFFAIPSGVVRPLGAGAALLTMQALLLIWSIGHFGDAAGANVVYGSRGVWGVLIVALLGRWYYSVEAIGTRTIFLKRLVGALVIAAAIGVLVLG